MRQKQLNGTVIHTKNRNRFASLVEFTHYPLKSRVDCMVDNNKCMYKKTEVAQTVNLSKSYVLSSLVVTHSRDGKTQNDIRVYVFTRL